MALPTAWQSAKPGSRQILLCRLQEIPVGKGTSLPSVEKKQLANKIAVGKEPVSCSAYVRIRRAHNHQPSPCVHRLFLPFDFLLTTTFSFLLISNCAATRAMKAGR
jgi:hypothetical protein